MGTGRVVWGRMRRLSRGQTRFLSSMAYNLMIKGMSKRFIEARDTVISIFIALREP